MSQSQQTDQALTTLRGMTFTEIEALVPEEGSESSRPFLDPAQDRNLQEGLARIKQGALPIITLQNVQSSSITEVLPYHNAFIQWVRNWNAIQMIGGLGLLLSGLLFIALSIWPLCPHSNYILIPLAFCLLPLFMADGKVR